MIRPTWGQYFMVLAKMVSLRSTCNSRPTGAVVVKDKQVLSTGYNGAMSGVSHCSDMGPGYCHRRVFEAPESDKYNFCKSIHAEANAIARAARLGISLEGGICYCTLAPCYVCLKLLAGAGIVGVYYEFDYESQDTKRDQHWRDAVAESPIEFIDQLKVSNKTMALVLKTLQYPTSQRRIT